MQRGSNSDDTWQVLRRYNDFLKLHKNLCVSTLCPSLPEKKFIGNMQPDFIAQRRFELQEYINKILMNPILASSLTTKKFIDPELYMQPFQGIIFLFTVFLSLIDNLNFFCRIKDKFYD